MSRTLSIETGFRCSNRCSFCYQMAWRDAGSGLSDPSFEQLSGKLKWGRENGYGAVGFSGGEPTVRKDFLDLVSLAVEQGYGRVSLTTNGRRFARPEYAIQALEAGIDSIGWSLHGPDEETHDALVGRDGAFRQLVKGITNVANAARQLDRRVDQNLFVLVNRFNHDKVTAICRLGRSLGIKLMILQPVIFSKGNLSIAASHSLPLEQLLDSVRAAALAGREEEWFVKLFNLPPCFFPAALDAFEHQRYPVDVFRYQEEEQAGESHVVAGQGYVRLERCSKCVLQRFCPGLHQSLLPEQRLVDLALDTLRLPTRSNQVWLAGTELLSENALSRFLRAVRERSGGGKLKLYYGGEGIAGDRLIPTAVMGGVEKMALLFRGFGHETGDIGASTSGDPLALERLAAHPLLKAPARCKRVLAIPHFAVERTELLERLRSFAAGGGWELELQLPWDFKRPDLFDLLSLKKVASAWRTGGGGGFSVVAPDRRRLGNPLLGWVPGLAGPPVDGGAHYAEHFFSSRQAGWICMSAPAFSQARSEDSKSDQPVLGGLPGEPIDARLYARMRPG